MTMAGEEVRVTKIASYNPNTPEYQALERFIVGDIFIASLAMLFPTRCSTRFGSAVGLAGGSIGVLLRE
jgi:hypothetical protein